MASSVPPARDRPDTAGPPIGRPVPIVDCPLGDVDDFLDLVDDDCRISVNSQELIRNGSLDRGPKLFADVLDDMRTASPDVHWEL